MLPLKSVRPSVPLIFALALASSGASAADCRGNGGYSRCIDANALWLRPGPEGFVSVPSARALPARRVAFGVAAVVLVAPLVLDVPSPDPEGREVRLVDHAVDEHVLLAAGLGAGFELGLSLTSVLRQRGSGSAGITDQDGPELPRATERDPRLSAAYGVSLTPTFRLKPRLELALPLGDEAAYASEGAVLVAPGVSAEAELGRFAAGGLVAVRARRAVELGSLRWGSQAELALGAAVELLKAPRLTARLEAFALPSLVEATSRRARTLGISVTSIPAEWLASLGLQPDPEAPWFVSAGAGSGLALSAEEREGARFTSFGATTPAFRALLAVRYAPER